MSSENEKVNIMNRLLGKVVNILYDNNIPYYLDCGSLLGCIRENQLLKHDTDVDVSIHLSYWNKLNSINFEKYGLIRTRTGYLYNERQYNIISLKFDNVETNMYCDIYANPAFPQLETKNMNNINYFIPKNSELYLTQLYGNWKIPSDKHADWPNLFYKDLITGPYSEYWDLDFEIKLDPLLSKKNLNKNFWTNYYKLTTHDIKNGSSFSKFVYDNYGKNIKNLLDLGCGNCRDSIFFGNKDIQVDAIDYNGCIEKDYNNITLIKNDVELYLLNKDLKHYDLVYMRWFLHAMPYEKSEKIFEQVSNILNKGDKICIEVRSINDYSLRKNSTFDKEDLSYKTTHKRWLYSVEKLEYLIKKCNMKKLYISEGYFSQNKNTETNNPLLIRCIIEKI